MEKESAPGIPLLFAIPDSSEPARSAIQSVASNPVILNSAHTFAHARADVGGTWGISNARQNSTFSPEEGYP